MGPGAGYGSNQSYFPAPQSPMAGSGTFPPSSPYGPPPPAPTWGYSTHGSPQVDRNTTYPPPILPSIHSFGRSGSSVSVSSSPVNDSWTADPEPTYRPWNADTSSFGQAEHYGAPPVDPALKSAPESRDSWDQNRFAQEGSYASSPSSPQYDPALYAASPYSHPPQQPQQPYFPNYQQAQNASSGPPPAAPLAALPPRNAYTRTLVGPLSSNGYRLLDEHRKPGIFFLFQDLSVRTEGPCATARRFSR